MLEALSCNICFASLHSELKLSMSSLPFIFSEFIKIKKQSNLEGWEKILCGIYSKFLRSDSDTCDDTDVKMYQPMLVAFPLDKHQKHGVESLICMGNNQFSTIFLTRPETWLTLTKRGPIIYVVSLPVYNDFDYKVINNNI